MPEVGLPDKDKLLRTLHYKNANGTLLTGLDANVAAWQHTARASRWRLLELPLIRPVARLCYALWARWRYWRLYGNP